MLHTFAAALALMLFVGLVAIFAIAEVRQFRSTLRRRINASGK